MLKEDREKLTQRYLAGSEDASRDKFADAVGIRPVNARTLVQQIYADFEASTYGIRWWSGYTALGTKRRIAISDHLYLCANAVEENLIEAKVHLLEAREAWHHRSEFVANSVTLDRQGKPVVKMPERVTAIDDLPDHLANIHVAGFLRAIGSTLDCLGTTIAGVVAVPTRLLKSDLEKAVAKLDAVREATTEGQKVQAAFRDRLKGHVDQAGPKGWIKWALDFRNMFVHRGRRLHISNLDPEPIVREGKTIVDEYGRPLLRTSAISLLPQDPGFSEIEAFLDKSRPPVIEEDADSTLSGILGSALSLVESTCADLSDIWAKRSADPSLLMQPREQWPDFPSGPVSEFKGYSPGAAKYDPSALVGNPTLVSRLQSAALVNEHREKWDRFD